MCRRRLRPLDAVIALSLLPCAAAMAVHYGTWHVGSWHISGGSGWVQAVSLLPPTDPRAGGPTYRYGDEEFIEVSADRIPEKEGRRFGVGGFYQRYVSFPAWLLLLPGALPTSLLVAWVCRLLWSDRAEGRLATGHCPSCAYDLTGNVSGVCPECGRKISVAR